MRDALVLTSTFPRWKDDSTPSFVYDLSNLLGKRHKVTVLAPHAYKSDTYEKMGSIDVHRFRYFAKKHQKIAYGAGILPNVKRSLLAKLQIPSFLISEFLYADRLMKYKKISIVHAHWIIPQGIIGIGLKKKYKVPLIVTVHGSDLFPLKNPIYKKIQKAVLSNADAITVNSLAAKDEIVARFPSLEGKIKLIPMGIDTKIFARKSVPALRKIYSKNRVILFVGRLNEQKGIKYLIEALPKIKLEIPSAKLLIVGEGEYFRELKAISKKLGVGGSVEFLGSKKKKELANYYNVADVLVLPAITSKIGTESFGLVLVEAMACGTCVVGSSSGGIKDIIKDGQNGLLTKEMDPNDIADKIINVLTDSKLAKRLGKNAVKSSRQYSWSIVSKKFDELYRRLK